MDHTAKKILTETLEWKKDAFQNESGVFFLQSSSHLQFRPFFLTIRGAKIFFSRNAKPTRVSSSIHPRYSILLGDTVDTVISTYSNPSHTPIHLVSFSLSFLFPLVGCFSFPSLYHTLLLSPS